VTNTPDLSPQGVSDRYKSLADIERGFRGLKSVRYLIGCRSESSRTLPSASLP
jgi:hypothetical protein